MERALGCSQGRDPLTVQPSFYFLVSDSLQERWRIRTRPLSPVQNTHSHPSLCILLPVVLSGQIKALRKVPVKDPVYLNPMSSNLLGLETLAPLLIELWFIENTRRNMSLKELIHLSILKLPEWNIIWYRLYAESWKNCTNELIYKTEKSHRHREQTYSYQGEKELGGMSQEIGSDIYMLLCMN